MDDEEETSAEMRLLQKQKKEKKELQAETQRMKHAVPKSDKKKRKEVMAQIAKMEEEQAERHKLEREQLNQEIGNIVNDMENAHITNNTAAAANEVPSQAEDKRQKTSKAQKRRERKAAKERERQERIKNQEVENLTGVRYIETQKLKALLAERGLAIHEIPSDGNCLYAAVVDQLAQKNIQATVDGLRLQAATYMRQHEEDFLPFLSKPDAGEPYTPEEYLEYCDRVQNTPEWGGQLELRALSNVLGHPIEVVQADAPSIIIGEEFSAEKLVLSYHRHMYGLGEHYNSVIDKSLLPVDNEDDEGFT